MTIKVLSCNVRVSSAPDGANGWPHRRRFCAHVIRAQRADVICFQEMCADQFADLSRALPQYEAHAIADEPCGNRRSNCVFYRRSRFRRLDAAGYWLSKTPHIAGSRAWNSACVRLVAWVRLVDRKSGHDFRVVNTHLDHVAQRARRHQARLIGEDAAAYPDDYPQILAGDMNCDARNPAIATLKTAGWVDTYAAVHGPADPGHTFHAFAGAAYRSAIGKMDWVFMRGRFAATGAEVVTTSHLGRFPSDHYFVSATLSLP